MSWKKKIIKHNLKSSESIIKKLKSENKINDQFLTYVSSLTLEELIAIKFELAAQAAGGMLYGLPIWNSMPELVKEALLKSALAVTKSKSDAASFLGVTKSTLSKIIKKYSDIE